MTDRDYAALCQRSYDTTPDYGTPDGPRAFRSWVGGRMVFCFPGSRSFLDWATDLMATPTLDLEAANPPKLGPVHLGFLKRANHCMDLIRVDLNSARDFALTGHSLGGAIALLVGAMAIIEENIAPAEIVTFGAPRAGFDTYANVLRSVAVRQYRFGADPIPLVPTHPYVHAREPLSQIGSPIRSIDIFENHHIANYINAL